MSSSQNGISFWYLQVSQATRFEVVKPNSHPLLCSCSVRPLLFSSALVPSGQRVGRFSDQAPTSPSESHSGLPVSLAIPMAISGLRAF